MRVEQRSQLAAMQQMESRSDEELEAETTLQGRRAGDSRRPRGRSATTPRRRAPTSSARSRRRGRRSDCSCGGWPTPRWRWPSGGRTISSGRPSGSASSRRPSRQLLGLRFMGLVAPPASAGVLARVRGIVIFVALVVADPGGRVRDRHRHRRSPPAGYRSTSRIFYSLRAGRRRDRGLVFFGRRRMKAAQAKRAEPPRPRSADRCAAGTRCAVVTPCPPGDPGPLPDRRVGRGPPALQCRASR